MNDQSPEVQKQEVGKAPAGAPPANANRMNDQSPAAPVTDLAVVPNPMGNRMNDEWAQPDTSAQADKAGKSRRR
jgi:hypothetical protein